MNKDNNGLDAHLDQFDESFSIHKHRLNIDFDIDFKFFAITPAFNINLHSKSLEIEWLFFGIYINVN